MNPWWVVPAMVFGVAGAWLLYLASPQQRWRAAPLRAWPGVACALSSLALLWPAMGAAAAVAMWLTVLMLMTTLAPFLGAWRARRREGAA
ncbi:hypothetical protein RDV84_20230 [Lysobacter yananisis]|jgi:hypothetical protein|uniref:DUF3325 domain-containing protein n=1 Tax=Lysobacter yananisis TaxID=1003114 RepID=A0ABY9P5H8_9GAMM|nr:hypothetical protein [Lysobacter yananisis]WMT02271.1 hypothetical protein RDV84_20230 [Lysobacter yananisis]